MLTPPSQFYMQIKCHTYEHHFFLLLFYHGHCQEGVGNGQAPAPHPQLEKKSTFKREENVPN
jgi:hypothetical protein